MKTAIVSDIHSNFEALKVVLKDIKKRKADRRICLGDVVGYGPQPKECIEAVRDFDVHLMGNHDAAVLHRQVASHFNIHARSAIEWTASVLSPGEIAFIKKFKYKHQESGHLHVHASPAYTDRFPYIIYLDDAMDAFRSFVVPICFFGHSHIPGIFTNSGELITKKEKHKLSLDCRHLINVGSIGQPRNSDPRACYVIYDDSKREVQYIKLPYKIKSTQKLMMNLKMPSFLINRLTQGR